MPSPSANTHVRREDARATLLAVEYFDTALTHSQRIILSAAVDILEGLSVNAPMTADQRRALFANFAEVFGHTDRPARLAFTGMVLGKAPTLVSWSAHKHGALTYGEAAKVLDALDALNV